MRVARITQPAKHLDRQPGSRALASEVIIAFERLAQQIGLRLGQPREIVSRRVRRFAERV
jgi:hypothetical protein